MKKCFICNQQKELSEFYSHKRMADGHLNKCIECTKMRERERIRNKYKTDPHWILKERARCRKKMAIFRKKDSKSMKDLCYSNWSKRNRGKRKSQIALNNAVRAGKIIPQKCHCGKAKVEAHHEDYSKPFDVIWLCKKHHVELHIKKREKELLEKFQKP